MSEEADIKLMECALRSVLAEDWLEKYNEISEEENETRKTFE